MLTILVFSRTLTFLYLPVLNFWLLLCPTWLAYDWQMGSVPLVTSFTDLRFASILIFYGTLGIVTLAVLRQLRPISCFTSAATTTTTMSSSTTTKLVSWYHRYLIEVDCSLGQFESAKLKDKEFTIKAPNFFTTLQKRKRLMHQIFNICWQMVSS